MNKSNQKRSSKQRSRASARERQFMDPPQMLSNVVLSHKFRYLSSSAFFGGISPAQVLAALGVCCTVVNTTAALLFRSFKINHVEIWSPPPSQGSASTVSIEWEGFQNSPSREYSDTTLSVSRNAHISCSPPKNSTAGFWQLASGTNLFTLNVPANTVIDLSISYIETDDESATSTVAIATGVLGRTYYLALDHTSSDLLVPVRLTTTV